MTILVGVVCLVLGVVFSKPLKDLFLKLKEKFSKKDTEE